MLSTVLVVHIYVVHCPSCPYVVDCPGAVGGTHHSMPASNLPPSLAGSNIVVRSVTDWWRGSCSDGSSPELRPALHTTRNATQASTPTTTTSRTLVMSFHNVRWPGKMLTEISGRLKLTIFWATLDIIWSIGQFKALFFT